MAAYMREYGLDVVGLDPSPHACRIARDHYGLEVVCGVLQEAELPEESFHAVTFFDVVEHLHDPIGDLRQAHRLLRPGGTAFVKVPNIAALQAHLFGKWWYALDVPRHLFHFSPRSLHKALKKAGFSQIACRSIPTTVGAIIFETSAIYWLRGRFLARKHIEVAPAPGQTVGEALSGKLYPSVPSVGKRAFRWLVRNVCYAPLAVENLVGRSVELLAVARK